MAETTQIHPDKVRAYFATDYRLGHTTQDIVLTIGQLSERLAALFVRSEVTTKKWTQYSVALVRTRKAQSPTRCQLGLCRTA